MTTPSATLTVVRVDDFVAAMIVGLAQYGYATLDLRAKSLYVAFKEAYRAMKASAPPEVELRFSIFLDEVHGSSPEVRRSLARAADRGLVSLDNPVYLRMRIAIPRNQAAEYMDTLPGGKAIYAPAVEALVDAL
jgi:hypothetical protein